MPDIKPKIKKQEKESDILDEFKNEVLNRKKRSVPKILGISFLILVVFGLLGVAAYQIFYKPEQINTPKTAEEKIENVPQDTEKPKQDTPQPTPTPTPTPTPAPTPAPTPTVTDYTVQAGDTWSSIANANGMTSANLMKYNGATSESLQIGQVIKIPKN